MPQLPCPQAAVEAARTALASTRSRSAVLEKAWASAAEQARAEQVRPLGPSPLHAPPLLGLVGTLRMPACMCGCSLPSAAEPLGSC